MISQDGVTFGAELPWTYARIQIDRILTITIARNQQNRNWIEITKGDNASWNEYELS